MDRWSCCGRANIYDGTRTAHTHARCTDTHTHTRASQNIENKFIWWIRREQRRICQTEMNWELRAADDCRKKNRNNSRKKANERTQFLASDKFCAMVIIIIARAAYCWAHTHTHTQTIVHTLSNDWPFIIITGLASRFFEIRIRCTRRQPHHISSLRDGEFRVIYLWNTKRAAPLHEHCERAGEKRTKLKIVFIEKKKRRRALHRHLKLSILSLFILIELRYALALSFVNNNNK